MFFSLFVLQARQGLWVNVWQHQPQTALFISWKMESSVNQRTKRRKKVMITFHTSGNIPDNRYTIIYCNCYRVTSLPNNLISNNLFVSSSARQCCRKSWYTGWYSEKYFSHKVHGASRYKWTLSRFLIRCRELKSALCTNDLARNQSFPCIGVYTLESGVESIWIATGLRRFIPSSASVTTKKAIGDVICKTAWLNLRSRRSALGILTPSSSG